MTMSRVSLEISDVIDHKEDEITIVLKGHDKDGYEVVSNLTIVHYNEEELTTMANILRDNIEEEDYDDEPF